MYFDEVAEHRVGNNFRMKATSEHLPDTAALRILGFLAGAFTCFSILAIASVGLPLLPFALLSLILITRRSRAASLPWPLLGAAAVFLVIVVLVWVS